MSRRSATTLSIEVRLRVPPGSNAAAVLEFMKIAINRLKDSKELAEPLASLDTDSMVVRVLKKETVYL